MLSYGGCIGYGLPGNELSEGADIQTTTLTGIAISATPGAQPADFAGWAFTVVPGAGSLDFPNGTTTGAADAGITDSTAASTTTDLPGPGYYELTASWNDGTTETLGIYATRPLPQISEATYGNGDATTVSAGLVTLTLSDSGGSDSPTYATSLKRADTGASVTVTDPTTTAPNATLADTGSQEGQGYAWTPVVTDAYGRTSDMSFTLRIAGAGPSNAPSLTPPADPNINADDSAPTVTFTNSGGAVTSTAASITFAPSGSSATLTFASPSLAPVLNFDLAGEYGVQLTGTNADGSDIRTAKVTVNSIAPTANAGPDQLLVGATSTVNLDGSSSSLNGGSSGPLSYAWTWSPDSPATATINNSTTATPNFTAAGEGLTYIPLLTVTDDSTGETDTDTVLVTTEAANRYPQLVQTIDFTTADPVTWPNGTTSGTITDDSGATTLATWTRITATGNSTGYNFHVSSEGFGFDTGLETSATGVTVSVRVDINWSAFADDLDGLIIVIVFTAELNIGTPGSGRDENVSMAVCPNGAGSNAAHTNGIRILNDNSTRAYYRRVAGALSQPLAMSYAANNRYALYLRADRYDGRVDVAANVSGLLSVSQIDTYSYDYSRIGASAISGNTVANTPYENSTNGPSLQFSVRNDYPTSAGGGPTQTHVESISVYTSGVAQP